MFVKPVEIARHASSVFTRTSRVRSGVDRGRPDAPDALAWEECGGFVVSTSSLAISNHEERVVSTNQMIARRLFSRVRFLGFASCAVVTSVAGSGSTFAAEVAKDVVVEPAVEWFAAEEAGQIEVKFIPKNATEATVMVKNLTAAPVRIKLPEAFAAVPINAQGMGGGMGGGGMGGGGVGGGGMGGGGMGGGGGQGMGGGMGGGGMGGGGMGGGGMGGGMMRVPGNKELKIKVVTVCLEHGKPDPNPKMAYKMIPAEQFTQDARVLGVCKMLGYGLMTQNTAQAAAWHLTDNLSWEQLAAKNRVESKYTGNVPFFAPFELRQASHVVAEVTLRYEKDATGEKPYYEKAGYNPN